MQCTDTSRSYRCFYFPKDNQGVPQPCESGALPSIRLKAPNGNTAELLAAASVHGVVASVERIEDDVAELSFEVVAWSA